MQAIIPTLVILSALIVAMGFILYRQRTRRRNKSAQSQEADELIAEYRVTSGLDAARERQEIARNVAKDYPKLGPVEIRRMAALIQDNLRQRARALHAITRSQEAK